MINGLTAATNGLLKAEERFAESAARISRGDLSPQALVGVIVETHDFTAQAKTIRSLLETDRKVLDLLA